MFCCWAMRMLRESATNVAKILKVSQPAVSVLVKRGEEMVKEIAIELLEE